MSYIVRHWRGDLSLTVSFWINLFLINVAFRLLDVWFTEAPPIDNPVLASQVTLVYTSIAIAIVYPWQIIGLWRSANKHKKKTNQPFLPRVVKALVVFGFIWTSVQLNIHWPMYKEAYRVAFGHKQYGDYSVELISEDSAIHIQGDLGYGVSKEVKRLITTTTKVRNIILDSPGGPVYEGRELSKIILLNGLNTSTMKGCYSACVLAFISGNRRLLAKGANLAFHQYRSLSESFEPYIDFSAEQQKDLALYERRGISQRFIDKIFEARPNDLWFPTVDELLESGVVHDVVNPSSIRSTKYSSFDENELSKSLQEISAFQAIKKYEPQTYESIIDAMEEKIGQGAGAGEIGQAIAGIINNLANKALPTTSNEALLLFTQEMINIARMLHKKDPFLCVKSLNPQQYGSIDITKYISSDELMPFMDALGIVIVDSYEANYTKTNVAAAEELMTLVAVEMEDNVNYLEILGLQGREDYSKTCKAFIRLYDLILMKDETIAANGLRFLFTE